MTLSLVALATPSANSKKVRAAFFIISCILLFNADTVEMFSEVEIEIFIGCLRNRADRRFLFFVCLFVFFFLSMWQYFLNLFLRNMRLILSKQIQRHRQQKTNEKPALIHCFCRNHVKASIPWPVLRSLERFLFYLISFIYFFFFVVVIYFSFPVKISTWCEGVKQVYAKVNKLIL